MNDQMIIRINKSTIKYGILFFLYFRPASYIIGKTLDKLCLAILCMLTVYLCLEAVLKIKHDVYHPSRTSVVLVMFFGWCMIGSTCLNYIISGNVSFLYAITTFLCELGIIIASDMGLEENPEHYLKLFVSIGGFFCLINEITMFVYGHRGGLNSTSAREGRTLSNNYFFFGEDNATFFLVWPVIVLTWIVYFKYKKTKRMLQWSIFLTLLTTIAYVYMWSVSNMIGCLATIGLIILYCRREDRKKVSDTKKHLVSSFDIGWILVMVYNYLLVIKKIFLKFSGFIENVLRKSVTLGGRLPIWERCLSCIEKQPLIGYGYETRDITLSKIKLNHAHNIVLEILYRGGIIGISLFVIALIVTGQKVKKYQDDGLVLFLSWCVLLFIFLCSIEFAFYRYPYIILFVLLGRCEVLYKSEKIENADLKR